MKKPIWWLAGAVLVAWGMTVAVLLTRASVMLAMAQGPEQGTPLTWVYLGGAVMAATACIVAFFECAKRARGLPVTKFSIEKI